MTTVLRTIAEVRAHRAGHTGPFVLVPTMGALHAGHLSLAARGLEIPGATVMATIFVNPLQFAEGEDLEAYPRTVEEDIGKLSELGVDYVFIPRTSEIYPHGTRTVIHPGPAGQTLEGGSRPTHFAGVLTVVNKLFNITRPTHAIFGEKDYQQLVLIRQMVEDLNMEVEIIGGPIVREDSGLAMSSRNKYLSADEAAQAVALSEALAAGAEHTSVDEILAAARERIAAEPAAKLDYLELRSPDLGEPQVGENRLLIAAQVGKPRLLDNRAVFVEQL
ncbi:pantoate--beta-alanine ligase [Corynebacterium phocae]|nr:pantoate--beta-alanine ligase [Corynebacterium phocae]KAA8723335.1 pantoate--beta-alanine ligase [Corynebacterium phocae]